MDELTPAQAVVECSGVGYLLNISLNTYTAIQGKSNVRLFVYEVIREDSYVLYGFESKAEREMFTMLISVSGIGGNTARMILSAIAPDDLGAAIASGNVNMLKAVKGIGAKTAQRIIVDLKDKIKTDTSTLLSMMPANNEVYEEALAALVMLGFTQATSQKVLTKLLATDNHITVEDAINQALKMM